MAAKEHFVDALKAEESPEARDGLGYALWWLGDVASALEVHERAYAAYAERDESRAAERLALFMSSESADCRAARHKPDDRGASRVQHPLQVGRDNARGGRRLGGPAE